MDFLGKRDRVFRYRDRGRGAGGFMRDVAKVVRDYLRIQPVREEAEGARLTVPAGFDPTAVRLTGNVVGQPPFTGTLMHRGWRVAEIKLPKVAEVMTFRCWRRRRWSYEHGSLHGGHRSGHHPLCWRRRWIWPPATAMRWLNGSNSFRS